MRGAVVRPENAARNAEIVRRRQAGEWPADICRAMGLSRNVVAGVLDRAGLANPDVDRRAAMQNALAKGRHKPGKGRHKPGAGPAKLTPEDVLALRAAWAGRHRKSRDGWVARMIERYGVNENTLLRAIRGDSWAHVK